MAATKYVFLTLFFLYITITLVSSQSECPSQWKYITGKCYRSFDDEKNWYEGRQACQSYDGDLVVIASIDLQNELTKILVGSVQSYWIGLSWNTTLNNFYWVDGTQLNPEITRWMVGEPNGADGGEDCVEMYGTTGLWNDDKCTGSPAGYMCERDAAIVKRCDEDTGWVSANGKCYKVYESEQTWESAKTQCRNRDGDLVDINSGDEQAVVTAMSQAKGITFWIGLTNKYYGVNTYKWTTGEPLTYANWAPGEPTGRYFDTGNGDCGQVLDSATNGQWSTTDGSQVRPGFMCERPEGTCAPGWHIHKGNCYQFNSHTLVSYTDAKHVCEAQGAFLVSIFSGEDNDYIVSQFNDLESIGITDVWIGIADYPTDGEFVWSDNSAVTFTNWNTNEPADTVGQHDCGMIYTNDLLGRWNTDNCYVLKAYVCKTRAGQPVYTLSPNMPVGTCPAGWNLFGDSCYYSDASKTDWNSAENSCVAKNSHLVAIHGEDEQSYISMRVATAGANTWIGLHDMNDRNSFMWSDGTSLDFSDWAPNNPNMAPSGEACVMAVASENREGMWDDQPCDENKLFICEKAKECETYTSYSTDENYYYRYHPSPLPTNQIEFEVRAGSDVHVSLSSSNTGQGQMYEVVIGGWTNSRSVIRFCPTCEHVADVQTPNILSASEYRGFIITYNSDGLLEVFKYGEGIPFMSWTDPNPFQINYVGYSTGYGFSGEFKFCSLDSGSDGTVDIAPTPVFDPRCGSGWEYDPITGNCYLFKPYRYRTWPDAEAECQLGGGNLVSIGSSAEMQYINGRMVTISESRLWIGATDTNSEGGWTWSDGSAFRFLNWNEGEPNNAGEAGEHCAEMYVSTGTWNDIYCTNTMGYVCKKNGYLVDHFNVFHDMNLEGYDNLELSNIYPEECAKQCVQQTSFTCRSFEYNTGTMKCRMSEESNVYSGVEMSYKENVDYYERPVGEQCQPGWSMFQGKCYYFDKHANRDWYQGRDFCKMVDGSDLVVIQSAEVENWLTTQIVSLEGGYWIGLHDTTDEGNFTWVDGVTLEEAGFSRWDPRQPDNYGEQGEDCVEMWTSGLWNDDNCNSSRGGVICDMNTIYDVAYEDIPPTLSPAYRCPGGWTSRGDYCYFVQTAQGSWKDARDQCRSMGAELVSIHDYSENQFVATMAIKSGLIGPLTFFWIGLNDLTVSMTFDWVDGSEVDYSYWGNDEPNNYLGKNEDCVEMDGAGAWNDQRCSAVYPSICKQMKSIIDGTDAPVTSSGCELGWTAYGPSCYSVQTNAPAMWNRAQTACQALGGNLVSIADKYEQTVVTSILSQRSGNIVWIGLNDLDTPGEYQWSDNTELTYTHWDYQEPKANNGDCVGATTGTVAGLWQMAPCGIRKDFLCKKVREGYTAAPTQSNPGVTPPTDRNCADGWIGYGERCFKAFNFVTQTTQQRTWQQALTNCKAIGGELASFHSADEENYIKQQVGEITDGSFWIGLHDRSQEAGFEWSDGTLLDYINWDEGEPNSHGNLQEDCVEMFFYNRGWNDNGCFDLRSWVCQIEKGKVPINTPPPPPSLPPYTPCPTAQDWVLEDNYCYYFSAGANLQLSWVDANSWCMDNGGYLVSIHSGPEQEKLVYYASTYSFNTHWIGIREYEVSGYYSWSDGTPIDYENWQDGEPNDANGEEQCGEMLANSGLWNDLNCGDPTPFICKRAYNNIIPQTYPPTPAPSGYCAYGWSQFGHRCYKIFGGPQSEQRTWYQARDNCNAQSGELAIVHSQDIQSFLTSKLKGLLFRPWIGLSDVLDNGQFRWVDGTQVDYTNWQRLEPNEAGGEEDCVELMVNEEDAGEWNDIHCDQITGYICQKNIEPSNPKPVESNPCIEGYVSYYESCFRVITSEITFQAAGAACVNDGYNLASIQDPYEQAFAETLLFGNGGNPLWIGMSVDPVTGEYIWQDGWPTFYTNWAFQEPSQGVNEGCVVMGTDGNWDDTKCALNYGALCKYTSLDKPTHPPDTPGTCPDGWLTSGSDCFLVKANILDLASFPEAQYLCNGYGARLASIHTSLENKLIYDAIFITATDVWIGMDREPDGAYSWLDGTPVNYLNWADFEPTYTDKEVEELCVEMYPSSGKWNDRECFQKQGYVCRASKNELNPSIPPGTGPTEPPVTSRKPTQEKSGMSTGAIVGLVFGVLAAVLLALLAIYFIATRDKSPSISKDPGLPPSIGFDNALYKSGDDNAVKISSTDPTSIEA